MAPPAGDLLAFCSFAYASRFGPQHELSLLAQRLKEHYAVNLRAFTTYVEGVVHEEADAEDLERAWQDAGFVRAEAEKAVAALDSGDTKLTELLAEWPGLPERLREMSSRAGWAEGKGRRLRLAFLLD